MITIDEVHTELVVEGTERPRGERDSDQRLETQMDNLRDVIRAVVREEFERYLRTEARR